MTPPKKSPPKKAPAKKAEPKGDPNEVHEGGMISEPSRADHYQDSGQTETKD